jgi:TetR/AcrR family transcriptional regulator, ethionamide resistance regulator
MALSAPPPAERRSRGRRTPRVSGADRERAILQTAERLLSERSLHEISVDDLARGAGISRPTFYFYFASKEAVLLTLLDGLVEEARQGVALAMLASDPPRVLRQGLQAIHETFLDHRSVTLAVVAARAGSVEVRELWARVMETFVQETSAAIESERARGAAPPGVPARDLAIALNWMNERVLHASFEGDGPAIGQATILDTLVEVWLRSIYGTTTPVPLD